MIRGTAQGFVFDLPCKYEELDLSTAKVVFWQDGNSGPSKDRPLPIIKGEPSCTQGDKENQLSVVLNSEETLRFSDRYRAKCQLWVERNGGVPVASREKLITVYPIYDDSIVGDEIVPTPDYQGMVILDGSYISTGE